MAVSWVFRAPAFAATLILAGGSAPAPARQPDEAAVYKALTGDGPPADDPAPVALGAWAGASPGMLVVATLEGGDDATDDLGALRVGLMDRQGVAWTVVASNAEADEPDLTRSMTPSVAELRIDGAAFRIAPREVAAAVDVAESLTTTSTSAEGASLHLYRRVGARLVPIFSTVTGRLTSDKSPGGRTTDHRWIVRFTPHLTNGFYDLVVQQRGVRGGRTFTWGGARYVSMRR